MLLAAMAVALGLGLVLGEVAVRVLSPQDLTGPWLAFSERGYKVNRAGVTVQHQFGARVVRYRFNAEGHRGGPLGEKAPGTRRVLVVGDSFTFGFLLEEPATAVARLQALADSELGPGKIELLNAAVGSWGSADYTAYVEDHAERFKPDTLLVFLNFDDPRRALESPLWETLAPNQLARREVRFDGWMPRLQAALNAFPPYPFLLQRSHLMQLARKRLMGVHDAQLRSAQGASTESPEERAARAERGVALTAALFSRLRAWSDRHGAELLVISTGYAQPADPEFGPYLRASPENEAFAARAEAIFGELGVPYLDLAPRFAVAGASLAPFRIEGDLHPNEAGAELMAGAAWPWLRARWAGR
jgi:hypothetical protein